ncbi:hypothetical protein TWF730_002468 [Orbilia blumenaviensis]|uniref:Uncharacterized protein n=1 Tax=Orbilia blumenaviensis TaxID=1796055 RepID=A0AAV9UDR0_9PEZI
MVESESNKWASDRGTGIIMPAFSNEIHWYHNLCSIQAAADLILSQNKFMNKRRLSFRVNGISVAHGYEIKPGDIIEVDGTKSNSFEKHRLDKIVEERRKELGLYDGDDGHEAIQEPDHEARRSASQSSDEIPYRSYTRRPFQYSLAAKFQQNRTQHWKGTENTGTRSTVNNYRVHPRRRAYHPPTNRQSRNFADRVGPKISDLQLIRTQKPRTQRSPTYNKHKIKLRFQLFDFGERPLEIFANNYEPLQIHFNVVKRRLIRLRIIDNEDELNFIWPHLRWIPHGNTRVHCIRTDVNIKTYACIVSKRDANIRNPEEHDNHDQELARKNQKEPAEVEQEKVELEEGEIRPGAHQRIMEEVDQETAPQDTEDETWPDLEDLCQAQGNDLISFSRKGSPVPAVIVESDSELSTIRDDEIDDEIDCKILHNMTIPSYITDDFHYS